MYFAKPREDSHVEKVGFVYCIVARFPLLQPSLLQSTSRGALITGAVVSN